MRPETPAGDRRAPTGPGPARPGPTPSSRRFGALATLAVIGLAVLALVTIPPLAHCTALALHGAIGALRRYVRSLGAGGPVLVLALILAHAVVPYPSEILTATAGYVFGFAPGLALAIVGWTLCAALSYAVGAGLGTPLLGRLLGRRMAELEHGMDRGGVALMLLWRLVPVVPFALLGYAAGATRRSLGRLMWTSFLGYLPLSAAVAYLGSRAQSLSASNPVLWVALAAILATLLAGRLVLRRGAGAGGRAQAPS